MSAAGSPPLPQALSNTYLDALGTLWAHLSQNCSIPHFSGPTTLTDVISLAALLSLSFSLPSPVSKAQLQGGGLALLL